jgi:predicted metal-dependent hydrolase
MTGAYTIKYGKSSISYDVVYAERKTLEIAVHPNYSVVIRAPFDAPLDKVEAKVKKRAGWIRRQIDYFKQFDPRTPPREYVGGESHLYLGKRYRLKIEQGIEDRVKLSGGFIFVTSRTKPNPLIVRDLMDNWYRKLATQKFTHFLDELWPRFEVHCFEKPRLQTKHMKTRWGSMSQGGILSVNVNLIRAPRECIEYVIMHELCHMLHHDHSKDFYKLLQKKMPDWEKRKRKLEMALL